MKSFRFFLLLIAALSLPTYSVITSTTSISSTVSSQNKGVLYDGSSLQVHAQHSHHHRREDEVVKVGTLDCQLTTSLGTSLYQGEADAKGIFFTLQAMDTIDILSIEFAVNTDDGSDEFEVQVWYRAGTFSGFNSQEGEWTQLADTVAHLSPDSKTAIVPAIDFEQFRMDPSSSSEYSLYIHMKNSNNLQLKTTTSGIGSQLQSDNTLQTFVGVLLEDGPFPATLGSGEAASFEGVIHYNKYKICDELLTTTTVEIEFAVGAEASAVQEELVDLVETLMVAFITTNSELASYQKSHYLSLQSVSSDFTGRDDDKCSSLADGVSNCSLITIKLQFNHLETISPLLLTRDVIAVAPELGDLVTDSSDFEVVYVGDPVISQDFVITLNGVSGIMLAIQKRYFERVTEEFMARNSDTLPIYVVEGFDEYFSGDDAEDRRRRRRTTTKRRTLLEGGVSNYNYYLRGSSFGGRRKLAGGQLQVAVKVYASGTESDLRTAVLDVVSENADQFAKELTLEHLRPGEINSSEDFGSYFSDIVRVSASLYTEDSFGESGGGGSDTAGEEDAEIDEIWYYLSIGGIVVSTLFIFVRLYLDCCHSPKMEKLSLDKTAPKRDPNWDKFMDDAPRNRGFDDAPRNRAGENGRNVKRNASMPYPAVRDKPVRSQSGDQLQKMQAALKSSEGPRNRAGQSRAPPSRTKSLPMGAKPNLETAPLKRARRPSNEDSRRRAPPSRTKSLPMGATKPNISLTSKDALPKRAGRRPSNESTQKKESRTRSKSPTRGKKKKKKKSSKSTMSPKRGKKSKSKSPKRTTSSIIDHGGLSSDDSDLESPVSSMKKKKKAKTVKKAKKDKVSKKSKSPKRNKSPKRGAKIIQMTGEVSEVELKDSNSSGGPGWWDRNSITYPKGKKEVD